MPAKRKKKPVGEEKERYKYKDCPSGLNEKVFYQIKQLRLQMLVHSYLYYHEDTNILDDKEFDRRAYELRDLQLQYPEESKEVDLYEEFKTWDGTTGFHLPDYPFVKEIAARLKKIKGEGS